MKTRTETETRDCESEEMQRSVEAFFWFGEAGFASRIDACCEGGWLGALLVQSKSEWWGVNAYQCTGEHIQVRGFVSRTSKSRPSSAYADGDAATHKYEADEKGLDGLARGSGSRTPVLVSLLRTIETCCKRNIKTQGG